MYCTQYARPWCSDRPRLSRCFLTRSARARTSLVVLSKLVLRGSHCLGVDELKDILFGDLNAGLATFGVIVRESNGISLMRISSEACSIECMTNNRGGAGLHAWFAYQVVDGGCDATAERWQCVWCHKGGGPQSTVPPPTCDMDGTCDVEQSVAVLIRHAAASQQLSTLEPLRLCCRAWSEMHDQYVRRITMPLDGLCDSDSQRVRRRFTKLTAVAVTAPCSIHRSSGCYCVMDRDLEALFGLPVVSLNLDGCHAVTEAGFACLRHSRHSRLAHLKLATSNVTTSWLAHLVDLPITRLDLSGCTAIEDAGLAFLAKLPLTDLDLTSCEELTDGGLAHLADLQLTRLVLNRCGRTTEAGLWHLTRLPLVDFSYDVGDMTAAGLALLAQLSQHLCLCASDNFTDVGLQHFARLPVTELRLSNVEHPGRGVFVCLARLPLKRLAVPVSDFVRGADLTALRGLRLTHLDLSNCYVTGGLHNLAGMATLQKLNLPGCGIVDDDLRHLTGLPLIELHLWDAFVTDDGLRHLAGLQLTKLDLSCCCIQGSGLRYLAGMPLSELIVGISANDDGGALYHVAQLPLRRLFYLGSAYAGFSHFTQHCTLQRLSLGGGHVPDSVLASIGKLTSLTTLSLGYCVFSDSGLAHLAALPLSELYLGSCTNVTDDGLAQLTGYGRNPGLTRLTELCLAGCDITNRGIDYLGSLRVHDLDLSCNTRLTDAGLAPLASLPLRRLEVEHCPRITEDGFAAVMHSKGRGDPNPSYGRHRPP